MQLNMLIKDKISTEDICAWKEMFKLLQKAALQFLKPYNFSEKNGNDRSPCQSSECITRSNLEEKRL